MKQISLATAGFELVTKRTCKRTFLDETNLVVPWTELIGLIQPYAAVVLAPMVDAQRSAWELCCASIFSSSGLVCLIRDGRIAGAPSSSKNSSGECDPVIHQPKNGNQWYCGMNAHIGVDAESGLLHSAIGTAANVHDVTQASALLHGEESMAFGDAGYQVVKKRPEATGVDWHVAMRPGKRRALDNQSPLGTTLHRIDQLKGSIRAKAEHPFRVIKRQFGFTKVRYKGLAKNTAQLITLFALSTWWLRKRIMQGTLGRVRLQSSK